MFFLGGEVFRPGHVVTGAPFSADVVTTSTQTLADGSHINQSNTMHVYRDSGGRTRREETMGNLNGLLQQASPRQMVFIDDPASGVNYALDATNKIATRSAFRKAAAPAGQPGGCVVGDGGEQDPENDRRRAQEARGEHQGEDLRLVADLGEADDDGRHEEGFHRVLSGSGGR